jgi:hypothetical protein
MGLGEGARGSLTSAGKFVQPTGKYSIESDECSPKLLNFLLVGGFRREYTGLKTCDSGLIAPVDRAGYFNAFGKRWDFFTRDGITGIEFVVSHACDNDDAARPVKFCAVSPQMVRLTP